MSNPNITFREETTLMNESRVDGYTVILGNFIAHIHCVFRLYTFGYTVCSGYRCYNPKTHVASMILWSIYVYIHCLNGHCVLLTAATQDPCKFFALYLQNSGIVGVLPAWSIPTTSKEFVFFCYQCHQKCAETAKKNEKGKNHPGIQQVASSVENKVSMLL